MNTAQAVTTTSSGVDIKKINANHVQIYQLTKALLPALREQAALLRAAKDELGDEYEQWVKTQLPISIDDAQIIIGFADEYLPAAEPFSQAAGVPPSSLLKRLERFCEQLATSDKPAAPVSSDIPPANTNSLPSSNEQRSPDSLTTAEKQLLLRHSPRLFARVMNGRTSVSDALLQTTSANPSNN